MSETKASPEKLRSLLQAKTVPALRKLAKELKLSAYSKLHKDPLVALILEADSKDLARHLYVPWWRRDLTIVLTVIAIILALLFGGKALWDGSVINRKLDMLISNDDSSPDSEKIQIIYVAEKAEENHLERLKQKYELGGYAILYTHKTDWYYIPRNIEGIELDWYSTEIKSVSKDRIAVQMPTFRVVENGLTVRGNVISIPRKVGATQVVYKSAVVSIVLECLEATDDETILVVGVMKR